MHLCAPLHERPQAVQTMLGHEDGKVAAASSKKRRPYERADGGCQRQKCHKKERDADSTSKAAVKALHNAVTSPARPQACGVPATAEQV